jgi:hypothetical protein
MRHPRTIAGGLRGLVLTGALCVGAGGIAAAATTPDDFRVVTTEDLVTLCSADPSDPNYVAAIHFCHGFGSGAFQYYQAITADNPKGRFVCVPNPPPTRTQAIEGFVAWARANPQHMDARPVDSLFEYLGTQYPCTQ